MKLALALLFFITTSQSIYAGTSSNLILKGFVLPTVNMKIFQTRLSSKRSLVVFSGSVNGRHSREEQKFEVEGLSQAGFEATLTAVTGSDRTVQYELLVNHLKETMLENHPIFLKISAN